MTTPESLQGYQPYRGLPALAGVCELHEAMRPGLSVEACVARHKRVHYALKRLHAIFVSRLTAEPIYELKMAFSLHAHLCAEHVAAVRKRVGEMREPPLGLDAVPDDNLALFFDEIQNAPGTELLVLGLYESAVPALQDALRRHLADTNPLTDHPSTRVCRLALLEIDEIERYGRQAIEALVEPAARAAAAPWLQLLGDALAAAGGLSGADAPADLKPQPHYSATPYVYDRVPKRDERFKDSYNQGVNAEAFLYDPEFEPQPKVLMMYFKRLREIDVPEMMSSIITETPGKPWDYYRDMTRQLWDEARHAMMGEVGFVSLGVDWTQIPVNFTWSLGLNTQLEPWERHAVLYFIERGLMPNSGKRFEWEVGVASHDPLSATIQDYDWADEVLHSNIGRDWYVPNFASTQEAIKYGDECWSKVLSNWSQWREDGLTQHRNWWPEIYRQACLHWEKAPDARVLGFDTTYENTRADLKTISASG
jgi:hypothetical protein